MSPQPEKNLNYFIFCPVEVIQDHRLSLIDIRVLACLYSFRNANTDLVWPKRATVAARCGYSEQTVSRATTRLAGYGWVIKTGKGGRSAPTKYRLLNPLSETVSDPDRVFNETVSDPDTKTVSDPDRGKELTNELTNKEKKINKRKVSTLVKPDWQPSEKTKTWFNEQNFTFTLDDMIAHFIDGCDGAKKKYKYIDHDKAFKNWSTGRGKNENSKRAQQNFNARPKGGAGVLWAGTKGGLSADPIN